MVIPDLNWSLADASQASKQPALKYTAKPIDRLAAQVFDVGVVIAPIFLLATAPFKVMLYHGFLIENQEEVVLASIAHVCLGVVLFIAYHFLCNLYFQTTLGKHLFRLQVVDVWTGTPLNAWRSLGRAIVSAVSFLSLGLAFLPMLSNDRRRALADLCFDSEVISLKPHKGIVPHRNEKFLVRGVYGLTIFALLFASMSLCRTVLNYSANQEDLSAWFMDRASKCEAIDEAMSQWPVGQDEKKASRLRVSLALYAAGIVDRKCLQSEADNEASFSNEPSALYYLAQSFAHSDETDISDSYLKQVCEQDARSSSCELSQIVSAWSQEDWIRMDQAFSEMKHPDVVAAVWAIRHFMKQGQPEQAFGWIKRVSPNKALGSFLQVQRVKALWLMNHTAEAQVGALQALESLPEESQVDLASWMCTQETSLECKKNVSLSCGWLKGQKLSAQDDPALAVAILHAQECSGEPMRYSELSELNTISSWPLLVRVVKEEKSGDKELALKLVEKIAYDENEPEDFRLEAFRRYIEMADNHSLKQSLADLKQLPRAMWRELQPRLVQELHHRSLTPDVLRDGGNRLPASEEQAQ